jgi:hypothetical protein
MEEELGHMKGELVGKELGRMEEELGGRELVQF